MVFQPPGPCTKLNISIYTTMHSKIKRNNAEEFRKKLSKNGDYLAALWEVSVLNFFSFSLFSALWRDKLMIGLKNCENGYLILKVVWVSAMHQGRGLEKLGFFWVSKCHAIPFIWFKCDCCCIEVPLPMKKKTGLKTLCPFAQPYKQFFD